MNPLHKYTPAELPKDPIHPVDLLISAMLWLSSLGVVICIFRMITQ